VSTGEHGEAWFTAADVAVALGQHPIARALACLREEEHCLHSQEGPGSEGCTLALISEDGLFRLLVMGESPIARRMRRWLTHDLLPAIQRSHHHSVPQGTSTIEAIRRQAATAVLHEAEKIIHLTGVSHAEALLSALEGIQANGVTTGDAELQGDCHRPDRSHAGSGEHLRQSPKPQGRRLPTERPAVAWLTAEQVAGRLDRTLRGTNQRLAASGLQVRNDEDDWQLTDAGRDWGIALPLCSRGERKQQILWDPAVLMLLQGES
jgi:hypothetical protein